MSDMEKTKFFYPERDLGTHKELDYLDSEIVNMYLRSIDSFTITAPFEFRPDLISFRLFGSYHYGWLIAMHNDFLDPVNDFKKGVTIDVPDIDEYFRFYNRNSISRSRRRIR